MVAVTVRQWAQRVLHGPQLADKLWDPPVRDDGPGPALVGPVQPSRAAHLAIAARGTTAALPDDLEDPRARGRLFHFFANHELLALELMALALLRFPDAPAAFRRGLVATLRDEQRHLRSYLTAMEAVGIELGAQPLSGFFWRVMASMTSPLDFVAHMALTFEQANLDFATHYAARLTAVGDDDGAARLTAVRDDEIGHVAHGRVWFQRWAPRGPGLLEAHRRALRPPTTLRRARGLGFDRPGREAAGLPADYIDAIEHVEGARGPAPVVYELDPTAELDLARAGGFTPGAAMRRRTRDLQTLPMFLGRTGDVVLVDARPSSTWLRSVAVLAGPRPQWCTPSAAAALPRIARVVPWGWSSGTRRRLRAITTRADTPPPAASDDAARLSKTAWRALTDDGLTVADGDWLAPAWWAGEVVEDLEHVVALATEWTRRGWPRTVIKAPFGTAGRNAQRIEGGRLDEARRRWLDRVLRQQGHVVVEPWVVAVCDVSVRIDVAADGTVRVDGVGRFVTDARGQYLGAALGPLARAVGPELARFLHGDGRDPDRVSRVAERLATVVGAFAHALGVVGPVGIDGLVAREPTGRLRLRPLVEVNARPNFGHVVHGIERGLGRRPSGLWALVRADDLRAGDDFVALMRRAEAALPVVTREGGLRQGAVATTDPAVAHEVLALLLVAPTQAAALAALATAAPRAAARLAAALGRQTAPQA